MFNFTSFSLAYDDSKRFFQDSIKHMNDNLDLRDLHRLSFYFSRINSCALDFYKLKQSKIGADFYLNLEKEMDEFKTQTTELVRRILVQYEQGTIKGFDNEYINSAKNILTQLQRLEENGIKIELSQNVKHTLMIMKLKE